MSRCRFPDLHPLYLSFYIIYVSIKPCSWETASCLPTGSHSAARPLDSRNAITLPDDIHVMASQSNHPNIKVWNESFLPFAPSRLTLLSSRIQLTFLRQLERGGGKCHFDKWFSPSDHLFRALSSCGSGWWLQPDRSGPPCLSRHGRQPDEVLSQGLVQASLQGQVHSSSQPLDRPAFQYLYDLLEKVPPQHYERNYTGSLS